MIGQRNPTSIQRFRLVSNGVLVDAIVLTDNRYLVLQHDTVSCCQIVKYGPDEIEYQCEYQRSDTKLTEDGLVKRIGTAVEKWRAHQITNLVKGNT